jgi:hypothetical protein
MKRSAFSYPLLHDKLIRVLKRRGRDCCLFPVPAIHAHDLIKHLLALERERIKIDIELGHQVDQRIDPALGLEEFIEHHHFLFAQDTIAALECAPFITDHITAFLHDPFYLIQYVLCVFHNQIPGGLSLLK